MDEFHVSNIDTHVGDACGVCILEEYQVTGLQVALSHKAAVLVLGFGGAVKADTVLFEYVLHKPGAIKSDRGASSP